MFKEAGTSWNRAVHGLYQSDVLMRKKMPPVVCQAKIFLFLRIPLTHPQIESEKHLLCFYSAAASAEIQGYILRCVKPDIEINQFPGSIFGI